MRFSTIQQIFFFGILTLATVAFLYIILPFIAPVFWALVLGILFYPAYEWFLKRVHFPSAASTITILAILALVLIPLLVIGSLVVSEAFELYGRISDSGFDAASGVTDVINKISPYTAKFGVEAWQIENKVRLLSGELSNWLAGSLVSVGQVTLTILIDLFIMLYLLFFIFKDGQALRAKAMRIIPLGDAYENELFKKFTATTRAVIKGTILIGIAQGAIGAAIFALVGISSPILWGTAMAVLSIIPGVGAGVIWFPAGVFLILTGFLWEGLFVLLGGIVLVSLVDNLLRPFVVGRDTGLPDAVVLLSTVGGLAVFGISGFIVGPIIAALCLTLWDFFEKKYQKELSLNT